MATKRPTSKKAQPEKPNTSQPKRSSAPADVLREQAQHLWLTGLGAFAKAQLEGNKIFENLVKETGDLPKRTRKAAQEQIDDMGAKAAGTWDKLEQVFEKRVAKALNTLGVPSHEDVDSLSRRVAELTAAVEALQAAPARAVRAPRAAPKPTKAAPAPAPAPAPRRTAARKAKAD